MSRKNLHSRNITGKIRSSLVLKLNLQMMGRLLSGFIAINILIALMSFFVILWKVEEGAKEFVEIARVNPDSFNFAVYQRGDYQIIPTEGEGKGLKLPNDIQRKLPIGREGAIRYIQIPEDDRLGLLEKIELVKYTIDFSIDSLSYRIVYPLGNDLSLLIYIFAILIGFEALILIGNLGKGLRMIRKTLKPLAELAETAKNLNAEVRSKLDGTYIKDLAGVISSIDANKLDSRLSEESFQDELKDLVAAINNMLDRIDVAYQSQVRFVSDASHELRTPISVIQGYVNLLDRWGKEDEETLQESIDAIKTEAENMKELVEKLLFLARSDNETIRLHKELFDSCQVIHEIIKEMELIDKSHKFEVDLKGPAFINADRQLIKQAIRILVDNSIKYTPSGEKIVLKVSSREEQIHISVQDNGVGIPPENLPNIFDRFYRLDESRARNTGGSGLGLSIAKWIVDRHGGYFEVLSRVGLGTRITMVLPGAKREVLGGKDDDLISDLNMEGQ
ncbi:MAG: HAMP domain-containing protein [Tissierellia bacterium]|nr:HAMP domain-containing protein [Tissierellia bacterium]